MIQYDLPLSSTQSYSHITHARTLCAVYEANGHIIRGVLDRIDWKREYRIKQNLSWMKYVPSTLSMPEIVSK